MLLASDFKIITDLCRHTSPNDHRDAKRRQRNSLVWNKTEKLLQDAEADVLEIFDWYADLDCRLNDASDIDSVVTRVH